MSDDDRPIVSVITEVGALRRPLDYSVPEGFTGPTEAGSRVRVPLHGRSVQGWIIGPSTGETPASAILPISRSMGFGPPLPVVELCSWAAWRWSGTMARFLGTASPSTNVTALPARRATTVIDAPGGRLSDRGVELAIEPGAVVERLGPATDPIDLVIGFAAEAHSRGGGSVLVLEPGLGYAARLTRRLAHRGVPAVSLADAWDAARAGWPIVVGTRSTAFAPVSDLAGMLVLDAEDERFRSEGAPTWSAVDVAVERARRAGVPAVLVTSCPTPALALIDGRRAGTRTEERGGWPAVVIADRTDADPRTGWFSEELSRMGSTALDAQPDGIAVACILNRTGRAKLLACRRCGDLARCSACDAAVGLGDDELVCPRCSAARPTICVGCGATAMKRLRPGTAQLAEELSGLLGVPTAEVTATTSPAELVGVRAVVGTEAIIHRIRRSRLVAFLDLDSQLLASRPGAELSTLAMIGRAGRMVGGRNTEDHGVVILQTRLVDHPVVMAATHGDPDPVVSSDLDLRRSLGLPPFRAAAILRGPGAESLADACSALGIERRPLGEGRIAVMAADSASLADALERAGRPKERVTVSVDAEIA